MLLPAFGPMDERGHASPMTLQDLPIPARLRLPEGPATVRLERPKGWQPVNVRELWEFRELLGFLVWRDVKVRYRQTLLGIGHGASDTYGRLAERLGQAQAARALGAAVGRNANRCPATSRRLSPRQRNQVGTTASGRASAMSTRSR